MPDTDYVRSIEDWRASLEAELRQEQSPIALVGLFWLQPGINTIGSSRDCTFVLPKSAPRLIGAFESDGLHLKFRADIGQIANVDGATADSGSSVKLRTDAPQSKITLGELTMVPVDFSGKLGIQVWDASRLAAAISPIRRWFDVDERFLLGATYTPYPAPVKLKIPDNLGGTLGGYAQGYVTFKLEGKTYNLDAAEGEDGRLLLQFRDRTNGTQTFSEGRFLHSEMVSEDGSVKVDLNKAFNPAGAFTSVAPSPVAPKTHVLNCAVEAGERLPASLDDQA